MSLPFKSIGREKESYYKLMPVDVPNVCRYTPQV